jgi:hypothetical protein
VIIMAVISEDDLLLFTACSLPIHFLRTSCSLPIHCLFTAYSLPIRVLYTAYSLPIKHCIFNAYFRSQCNVGSCGLVSSSCIRCLLCCPKPVHCVCVAYALYSLPMHSSIHCLFTASALSIYRIYCLSTVCSLSFPCLFTVYSLPIHLRGEYHQINCASVSPCH